MKIGRVLLSFRCTGLFFKDGGGATDPQAAVHISGLFQLLPTVREDNVFTGVCHSVHNGPHGYSVTVHPCYGPVGTHPTGILSCFSRVFAKSL